MTFKVAARTVLQLGAELISSDAVAFYELIKNAFDARSPRVEINVVNRIPHESIRLIRDKISNAAKNSDGGRSIANSSLAQLKNLIIKEIDVSAPDAKGFSQSIEKVSILEDFDLLLNEANYIDIIDKGEGMSLRELRDNYLTIGTRARLEQREEQASIPGARPILGEKGLGRLSAMRLGSRLKVTTSKADEPRWNVLEVDWNLFSNASDKFIEDIEISPEVGAQKEDPGVSGTTIHISDLQAEWSREKLETIARDEFSRLTDPFIPRSRYPITLRFNGGAVPVLSFDKLLFQHAHAIVNGELRFDAQKSPHLIGSIEYTNRNRQKTFEENEINLVSLTGMPPIVIQELGPFKFQFYWFNRRLLTKAAGVPDAKRVRDLVNQWAGGLMLYRDGFRVHPYGSPEDDWLNLDRSALAAPGYKVNRRQVIGKVDISAHENPKLVDQTNREGLRDTEEKTALIKILQHVLISEFRTFLDAVDSEVGARDLLSFDEVEERVSIQEKKIDESVRILVKRYPEVANDIEVIGGIQKAADDIRSLMKEAAEIAEEYEKGRTELLHLAGIGLMVEIIGHELNRAAAHAIRTLDSSKRTDLPPNVLSLFDTLKEELKTLEKRLRILDPLATAGRQVKQTFDVVDWVREILQTHSAQFDRHGIICELQTMPNRANAQLPIRAVKGMIVQILENLISNSVYWLSQQKRLHPAFKPKITVRIDTKTKQIEFTDNGPGVSPNRKDEVFQPFVTTKPPGKGKGLGLYISREIAEYNNANLYLSDERTIRSNSLNTFVLILEARKHDRKPSNPE